RRGYINNLHSYIAPNSERYRCKNRKCLCAIIVDGDNVVFEILHNHPEETQKITRRKVLRYISKRGVETNENFSAIINHVVGDTTSNIKKFESLPMLESIRDMVRRDRNRVINFQPEVVADIIDFFIIDRSGNEILRYDSGIQYESRFIIFMHTEQEKFLKMLKN
ncbi:hypothetical protein DMUE_5547, partial [Dictyocoela muelleri]